MKKALLATLLLLSANTFAQTWVQVPGVNFQNYLTAHYPAAAFMTSGSDFFVDADNVAIQAEDSLNILGMSDIEGVQAFENLTYLVCSNSALTTLPALPSSLTYLDCSNNSLTVLPNLPPILRVLRCESNQITALPALPTTLKYLFCSHNLLTSIPTLTPIMVQLNCDHNSISALPVLPAAITDLSCSNNPLTALPQLPSSLSALECMSNQLTVLPDLPNTLTILWCDTNQLTVLPDLPVNLTGLTCSANQLIALPALPLTLTYLTCSSNQLSELPDLPSALEELWFDNNLITCVNKFPEALQFIAAFNNLMTCVPNYVPGMLNDLLSLPLCDINDPLNNPNGCPTALGIEGELFLDSNSDCVSDGMVLKNIPVTLFDSNDNLIASTSGLSNGNYDFPAESGNYNVKIDTDHLTSALQVTCPVNNESNAVLSTANPLVTGLDFGLKCAGLDLGVQSVVPYGLRFPGQTHLVTILAGDLANQYNLSCASGVSGEVTIQVSGPGTVTFSDSAATISGNTVTYSVADFGAPGANEFTVAILTDTTATSTDEFCLVVTVSANVSNELDTTNNSYNYCYGVVNSFDPNIKETYPEILSPEYSGELTYTIHFQNTGNAPAMNIRLADVLSEDLDLSALKIVNASADYTYSLNTESRLLSIRFPNIMLADSASDPAGSIGFVQYRIHPIAGLTDGTIIENTASIYFDYNDPIVTNTSENLVSSELNVTEDLVDQIRLYPNPAKNDVTFESEELIDQLEFYSLNGTKVLIVKPELKKAQVDISALQNGVYIVKVQSPSGVVNKRFVVSQ